MELNFCDLCQEAVPTADLDAGKATLNGKRVVCRNCNVAMGVGASTPDAHSQGKSKRQRALVSPMVAAMLAVAAISLSLVAVVALLVRVEALDRAGATENKLLRERITYLEERQAGTRDGMIARARQAAEDAIYAELERFETFERQMAEIREALLSTPAAGSSAESDNPEPVTPIAQRLAVSDESAHVAELEEQLLFLQARVFELLEASTREGSRIAVGEPEPRLLVPEGDIGVLLAQLSHEDPIERVSALYALAHAEDVGVVRHVTPLLKDDDAYIRALSARILERMKARSSAQSLIEALGDVDVGVREAAVSALRAVTGRQFQFDPRGPGNERYAASKRWNAWWSDNWKTFLYQGE